MISTNIRIRFGDRMRPLSGLVFVLALIASATTQGLTPEEEQKLRDFIAATMDCRDSVGLSVAMVKDDVTVFADGFGYRDLDNLLPLTANTRINIGSLTKAFTSTLLAESVSRGLVDWDAPLTDVLGNNFGLNGEFRSEEVSLRDLLCHKTGIPSYWGVSTAAMNVTREELCMQRMRYFDVLYNFRDRYLYSNYGFVLAGYVDEVVSGLNWEEKLQTTLLNPLGMTVTKPSTYLSDEDWDVTAYSYTEQEGQFVVNPEQDQLIFLTEICPAGCIFSTAVDMASWMRFHFRGGTTVNGTQIVPQDDLRTTYAAANYLNRPSTPVQKPQYPVDQREFTYALGWRNGMYRGYEQLAHTGSYSSYNCRMALLPDVSAGVWTCVSSPGDSRGSRAVEMVNFFALDMMLGVEPWLNETTTCTYPDPWRSHAKATDSPQSLDSEDTSRELTAEDRTPRVNIPLESYAGIYNSRAFGNFSIFLNATGETLRYEFGRLLSGELNRAGGSDVEFHMTLDPPISYRMVFFPQYPDGFPFHFNTQHPEGIVLSISVPYLEFDLPPVFDKIL